MDATEFVGRDTELNALKDAWRRTAQGTTNIVVLVGESRLGKTRIVQELYGWLNAHEDPDNYWPDSLVRGRDSLEVNPRFDPEGDRGSVLPWLWWGVRWQAPQLRNPLQSSTCAVLSEARHLDAHLEGVRRLFDAQKANREALINVGAKAASLMTGGALDAAISLAELVRSWIAVRRAGGQEQRTVAQQRSDQSRDMLSNLERLLVRLVSGNDIVAGGIPLALVLDDVQWADRESMQFVLELAKQLLSRQGDVHPAGLLIVATCWEREWNESYDFSSPHEPLIANSFGAVLRMLEDEEAHGNGSAPNVTVLRLRPIDSGLETLVATTLPGLTEAQRVLVSRRAGGSPGFLMEILLKIQRSRHLFEQSNPLGKLTTQGETTVETMLVQYQDLVEERLQCLSEPEARVLRLASYFGLRFSETLVRAVVTRVCGSDLGPKPEERTQHILSHADHPLALVQSVGSGAMEFRLPVYRDVLRRHLSESENNWERFGLSVYETLENLLQESARKLPETEREIFLEFAVAELDRRTREKEDDATRVTFLVALAYQIEDADSQSRRELVTELLRRWRQVWGQIAPATSLAVGPIGFDAVLRAGRAIDVKAVDEIARTCLHAVKVAEQTDPTGVLRTLFLLYVGDASLLTGDLKAAREAFGQAMNQAQSAITTYGDTEERLQNIATVQTKMGDVLSRQGETQPAQELYRSALQIAERLVTNYGTTAVRLRQIALLKAKTGDLAMNIGLVANAHGKVCLVHDVPFEERPLRVGYHVDKRQLEIIFDVGSTYPIDWVATDEMHEYLLKINKILIIRMQDKRPIEGWDSAFLRIKDGKTIN